MNEQSPVTLYPNAAFILIEQSLNTGLYDLAGRVMMTVAQAAAQVLAISQASASGNFSFVVPGEQGAGVFALLHQHFASDLTAPAPVRLWTVSDVVLLTVGADGVADTNGVVTRVADALAARGANILMLVQGWRTATMVVQASAGAIWEAVRPITDTPKR